MACPRAELAGQCEARRYGLDLVLYGAYSWSMTRTPRKGAEEARNQLPALLSEAAKGNATIITRHGRSIAAIVPIESLGGQRRQKSLVAMLGSGKGLWGVDSRRRLRRMREEWSR